MCGIVGYAGNVRTACGKPLEVCLQGLQRLEYRGYDSAGVALTAPGMERVAVRKKAGRLANLVQDIERDPMPDATVGIGHTRWATNGVPNDTNAHPHTSRDGKVAIMPWDWALKFTLTIATLAAGYQGGEVTPLFSIGASLGVVLAGILGMSVELCAALGYAAVFGSATNTLLAPILIGCEVFGFGNLPAFFIVCVVAYLFNMDKSIYALQERA